MHSLQATWRRLLDLTRGSLPDPSVQTTGSPTVWGTAYMHAHRCALKRVLLLCSKGLSYWHQSALSRKQSSQSFEATGQNERTHSLQALLGGGGQSQPKKAAVCQKKCFIIPNFLLHPIRLLSAYPKYDQPLLTS